MRFLIFIIYLSFICLSCSRKDDDQQYPKFKISFDELNNKWGTWDDVFFHNEHYYILTKDTAYCFDENFELSPLFAPTANYAGAPLHLFTFQRDTIFAIQEQNYNAARSYDYYYLNGEMKWTQVKNKSENRYWDIFNFGVKYKDSLFTVISSMCKQYGGGKLLFVEASTGRVFVTGASCLLNINKINNAYYITASLKSKDYGAYHKDPRNEYYTQVKIIKNPTLLFEFPKSIYKSDTFNLGFGTSITFYIDSVFKKSNNPDSLNEKLSAGVDYLIDTFGYQSLTTFLHNERPYHLIFDGRRTYVSVVGKDKITFFDTVKIKHIETKKANVRHFKDRSLYHYYNDSTSGLIVFKDDSIKIYRYKNY